MHSSVRRKSLSNRLLVWLLVLAVVTPFFAAGPGSGVSAAAENLLQNGGFENGRDFYMAEDGSDSNDGSIDHPFATVAHFNEIAEPGDTLFIREGFYEQSTDITTHGTADAWITIRNYPGELPVFDGSDYWTNRDTGQPTKTRIAAFFGNAGSHHFVIQGLMIQNYYMSGITIGYRGLDGNGNYIGEPATDYILRYNLIDRVGQNGLTSNSGAYNITYEYNIVGRTGYELTNSWSSGLNFIELEGTENYIRGNVSYHNIDVSDRHTDGNGMILDTSGPDTAVIVENNLFFLNGGVGIAWTDASNAVIRNNTLYENGQDPSYINGPTGMAFWEAEHNIDMTNNIVYQRNKNGLKTNHPFDSDSVIESNNISGQPGAHNPQFSDPANADFTLKPDSPDIDRGYAAKGPADTVVFDHLALKRQTEGQPVDWYTFAPDVDYIKSVGGVEHLFQIVSRTPENGRVDLGAFTSNFTNPDPDAVIPDEELPPEPPKSVELLSNAGFETGTNGWTTLGSTASVINSIQQCQSGYQCLQVSDRTQFWNGIFQSVTTKVKNDKTYNVSGYIKLPAGAATTKEQALYVKIVMSTDPVNDQGTKDGNTYTIGKVLPTAGEWKQIAGTISTPASGTIEEFQLLVQGAPNWGGDPDAMNDTTTLLVDNLSIKEQVGGVKLETKALSGTPAAIDGAADPVWDTQNWTPLTGDGSLEASYKAVWDEENLYILAVVADASVQAGDKIDFYVNGNYDKNAHYNGANDRKLSVTRNGTTAGGAIEAAAVELEGGYAIETRIPFADGTFALGDVVGFDLKVTDGDTSIAWNNQDLQQDADKQVLGKLILSAFTGEKAYVPKGTPDVDLTNGIDPVWQQGAVLETEIVTGNSDKTGLFRVLWDENYLYVLAHVSGDKPLNKDNANAYEHDSIEIFKDENNGKTTGYQNDDGQFRVNYANEVSINSKNSEAEITSSTMYEETEYWVASKIKWTDAHALGDVVGFDLQVNDTNGGSARTGTINWSDATGQGWQSTAGYGIIMLAEGEEPPAPDTEAPSKPTGLQAENVTTTGLTLKWTASTDNVGVTGYDVYRGETKLTTVTGTTHAVTGLTADTSYTFTVVAKDAAGNTSALSDALSVRTAASTGGSGSGGSNPGPVTPPAPVVTGGTVAVTPTVTGTTAAVTLNASVMNTAIEGAAASNDKRLSIDLGSQSGVTAVNLELPASAVLQSDREGIQTIAIKTPFLTMNMSTDAIKELDGSDGTVKLEVKKVDPASIPAAAANSLNGVPVFEFNLSVDNQSVQTFKTKKSIGITVPYTLQPGQKPNQVVAAFVAADGTLEIVKNAKYDEKTGMLTFYPEHFSMYAVTVKQAAFTDLARFSWAQASIEALAARGIITGTAVERFEPGRAVTRAEFLAMLIGALGLEQSGAKASFGDVKESDWHYVAVASALELGIVSGYKDGTFAPDKAISREEMAVMAAKAIAAAGGELPAANAGGAFKDAQAVSAFAADAVRKMQEAGILSGDGSGQFRPKGTTTRAEAAKVIYSLFSLQK